MLKLRKILFFLFCLIYLILTPLIIAQMLGFVIDPLAGHFVKTGLVYVSTTPPEARILMDGHLIHDKTPTIIRDLTPGQHFIRIQLEGYRDWKGYVPVVAKKATVLENTLLVPQKWPIQRLSHKPYQNLMAVDEGILIGINPRLKDIDIFQTNNPKAPSIPLIPPNSIYAQGQLIQLFHAPQSPYILLDAIINSQHKFLRIHIKNRTVSVVKPKDVPRGPGRLVTAAQGQQSFLINNQHDLLQKEGFWIRLYPKTPYGSFQSVIVDQACPSSNMYFEEKSGTLFYLHKDNMFLYTVKIVHPGSLLNRSIPEKLRLSL